MRQRTLRDQLNINIRARLPRETEPLGFVYDISLDGLALSGGGMAPRHPLHFIVLMLPWPVEGITEVELELEPRWQEYGENGRWHAGFKVVGCPDEQKAALEKLARRFTAS